MTPEESALLVKLQVMKAERDLYRQALEEIRDKWVILYDYQDWAIAVNQLAITALHP